MDLVSKALRLGVSDMRLGDCTIEIASKALRLGVLHMKHEKNR